VAMLSWRRGMWTLMGPTLALALLVTGCGKSTPPSSGPPSTSASAAGVTVQQGAGAFVFSPATFSVAKGASVTVTNVGSASHTFTVTGKGIDVVNQPGQSQSVTIDLPPGTYPFVCRFHVSLGMKGTLTVTG
jgi:plastocyanin